jgi:3-phenylpropionate/cinnamic acid dioxygenase small subunit
MARKAKKTTRKKTASRKTTAKKVAKKVAKKPVKKVAKKIAKKSAPKKAVKKAPRKASAKKAAPAKAVRVSRDKQTRISRDVRAGGKIASAHISNELMLRLEIEELYAAYAYCLDHGPIDDWPDFFTENCLYKLISRENYDLGLPLGTMFAEKRGGLLDRVVSVKQTTVYHERYLSHLVTGTRVLGEKNGVVEASANYIVIETLPNQYTQILNAGRYLDKIVREGGRLKFKEKLCIFDSVLVPASIITPI